MQTNQNSPGEEALVLTPEMLEEIKLARRCFTSIERLTMLMGGYPPGHPTIETGVQAVHTAFYEFFELNDRLTVQVHPHWMQMMGTEKIVWETQDPKDFCFALSRDGIYLIHLLAGIDIPELRRFVEVLNELIDMRDMTQDAVSLLFAANFRYISYDAIDESLAILAGLDSDLRDRDTREEQEMIDELFNEAFDKKLQEETSAESSNMSQDFEVRLQKRGQRQQKLEIGSRQFLELEEESRHHLLELKLGFTEHNELEHRQGEILSAMLGANPKEKLRVSAVGQIGNVMGSLLETDSPWETLAFLKIMHEWRDKFGPEVADELKEAVKSAFSEQRLQGLIKQVAVGDAGARRSILQMFNALHLEEATGELVNLLGWNLGDEAREDILRYVRERARYGLGFIQHALLTLPAEHATPLLELAVAAMPRSRPMLVEVLRGDAEPPMKARALAALHGTWTENSEIRDILVPLVGASHSELRLIALRSFAQASPQHVARVVGPMLNDSLRKRPEDEVREFVHTYATLGKQEAVETLKGLLQRRGLVGEAEQELGITIARALIRTTHPAIIAMLESIAKDWLVNGRIRATCKEIVELLQSGQR
ncbi:MAG: hypothetical protein ACNA8W_15320 [Bradymonadaceae bacterium]